MGYVELFVEEETNTYYDPGVDRQIVGITALRERYKTFAGLVHVPKYEVVSPMIQLVGEAAVVTYTLNEYADDGSYLTRWRATEVRIQVGDQWKMIHSHWSLYMEPQE